MNNHTTQDKHRETWFTSDTHFGHDNIIRYCDRPYRDAREMDEALIANWNACVGDDEVVYHLADFTLRGFGFAKRIIERLRGRIRVLGYHWHHDARWLPHGFGLEPRLRSASGHPIEILPPMVVLEVPKPPAQADGWPQVLHLSHYPIASWDRRRYGAWHLHGHSHGTHRAEGAIMDMGVDCHGYQPVALSRLPELFADVVGSARHDESEQPRTSR